MNAKLVRLSFLMLLVAAVSVVSAAPEATPSPFAAANAYYERGEYQQARERYRAQLQSGPVTAPLLYNLGNACYQSQQLGWAVLYYERARLAAPRDRDLRANLGVALGSRRVPPSTTAPGWGQVVWRAVVDRFSLNELAATATLCYLLTCGLLVWWLRGKELRRRYRWVLVASLALTLLTGAIAVDHSRLYHDPRRAVIVADGALMSGPADSFPALRKTYQGELARIVSVRGMWREVQLEAGTRGWVPQSGVELIVPPRRP